jgi:hypothetical protein
MEGTLLHILFGSNRGVLRRYRPHKVQLERSLRRACDQNESEMLAAQEMEVCNCMNGMALKHGCNEASSQ